MKRYRIYVVGAATYLTIEHPAASATDLFSAASRAGFLSAAAMERNGRRRNVLIPFANIALIAEAEDQGPRLRQAISPGLQRLS